MIQFQNVLCPVDFFPASKRALEYAAALARNYGARLHILHVVSPIMPTTYEFALNTAEMIRNVQEQAAQKVEKLKEETAGGKLEVQSLVPTGDIDTELKKAIETTNADIVIMGTHGRRGFERWILGSVAERLLRHSPVPVLTMSDLENPPKIPPAVEKIIVTTDFSEGTREAMAYALAIAQEAPADVTLLHVVEQPPERAEPVEGVAAILEEHLESMVPDSVRQWCSVQARVEIGTPYQRILAIADETPADLLVMNIHGRGMVERALMGTTAERVLRGAQCPVLAVPPKG